MCFSVSLGTEVTRINKKGKQITKATSYNLLIVQDLWQDHYQIFFNNLAKGIHEVKNINMDIMIKNAELVELNTKIATAALKTQTLII